MPKSWVVTCLINFLIASLMGLLLRLSNVTALGFEYAKMIHAHSHTAMLGWVYMMIYGLFVHHFVPSDKRKKYSLLYWLTQLTVIGMMVSFPVQGYALFSIIFSTLHIVCSYILCYRIWKDNNARNPAGLFLRTAIIFMLASTLGAWSVGIAMNLAGKDSALYQVAIQFFLHFQFNGWFVFSILSIFFDILRKHGIALKENTLHAFYYTMVFSAIVTFALPVSWYFPSRTLFFINVIGVALQAVSLVYFFRLTASHRQAFFSKNMGPKWLLGLSLISFATKVIMQAVTVFPAFALASHAVRNFTIGFIHLGMLGVISGFLFFFLTVDGFQIRHNAVFKSGLVVFYTGFLLTESILFCQGMLQFLRLSLIAKYDEILLGATFLLPIGLALIIVAIFKRYPKYDLSHI